METFIEKYNTIESKSEGLYKEKGSKFLSYAIPVKSVEEIKGLLNEYRKQHFQARHVCYAYMLGAERLEFRNSDDGEPSGTAGRPILGQINSRELSNVLIIVVRYFGGILLGTGGLITAYKEAAADALANAKIIEINLKKAYLVKFNYLMLNDVMKIIKRWEVEVRSQEFENECSMVLAIEVANEQVFVSQIEDLLTVHYEDMGLV